MKNIDVLLGLQWGDEGKGKVVDFLANHYQVVARFQGGPNAGHTLEFEGNKHVLHQIPSGIFRNDVQNIIGNGVVLDAIIFKKEIENLQKYNINFSQNLFISKKAQLILPTHRLLDAAQENAKGKDKVGSTLKGISPTYTDKIARNGLRVADILEKDFSEKYENLKQKHLSMISFLAYDYTKNYDLVALEVEFWQAIDFLKTFNLVDSEYMLNDALTEGKNILAEGAQGTLLDIDFGSYPFVTSSSTTAAGACTGLGIAPNKIKDVFGIFKAYCTRVGSGAFPTELEDATGEKIRTIGREVGATTGRQRRCGWLDLPALKYAIMLNGVTQLFMMKADVLDDFEEIKVCTNYQLEDGTITEKMPHSLQNTTIIPVYKTFKGWNTPLTALKNINEIPTEFADYIDFLEKNLQTPIKLISVGPDREQTIIR